MLSFQDTQQLLDCIQSIYALKSPETFGYDVLKILAPLVPVGAACAIIDHRLNPHRAMQVQGASAEFEATVKKMQPFVAQHLDQSPFVQNASTVLTGAYKFSDFVDRETLYSYDWTQQVVAAFKYDDHMLLTLVQDEADSIFRGETAVSYLYFYRNWDEWTERDRYLLNLLRPHLIQAFHAVQELDYLNQSIASLQQSLDRSGIVEIDAVGGIRNISAQVTQWLTTYFSAAPNLQSLPETLQRWFQYQLSQLNSTEVGAAPCLPLRIQQDDRQLNIRLMVDVPQERYILLMVEETILPLKAALQHLGLTQREADVLFGVVQGWENQAIAKEMGVTVSTVRKHLENIYVKLGVQSRAAAVSVALEKLGCLNSATLM
jgi:DNA-binding CsgD family transcriptional regulator